MGVSFVLWVDNPTTYVRTTVLSTLCFSTVNLHTVKCGTQRKGRVGWDVGELQYSTLIDSIQTTNYCHLHGASVKYLLQNCQVTSHEIIHHYKYISLAQYQVTFSVAILEYCVSIIKCTFDYVGSIFSTHGGHVAPHS